MTRALGLLLCGALSGCGLVIDGAYLLSGDRYTVSEKQTRRTEYAETKFEHQVRAESGQLWLACEDIERGVDRVWTVKKEYERRGGFYQAHWLPVILGSVAGGISTAVVGVKCAEGELDCNLLWATVPVWSDVLYSAVRLAMIQPPKLVGKERGEPSSEPSETPNWRRTVACEPDAAIVIGRGGADPMAQRFRVDAWGAIALADLPRALQALRQEGVQLMWSASGPQLHDSGLARCTALAGLGSPCPPAR